MKFGVKYADAWRVQMDSDSLASAESCVEWEPAAKRHTYVLRAMSFMLRENNLEL